MIEDNVTSGIPEIGIKDFNQKSCGLLLLGLDEFQNRYSQISHNPHRISYYQLILIISGEGNFGVDTKKYRFNSRTFLSASKGQIEVFEFDNNVTGYVVLFSDEFICRYPEDIGWINNLKLFDRSIDSPLINVSNSEYSELLILLKRMESEYNTEDDFAKDEILMNLLRIFLLKSERIKRNKIPESTMEMESLRYLVKFMKLLEENYDNSRSVTFYADSLNITCKKLNQITSSYWGKSAKQVIEERVLLETKRLLIHTCRSIKEIGSSLGFDDPTNFNKFFKKYVKVTPATFRISKKEYLYHKTASNNH